MASFIVGTLVFVVVVCVLIAVFDTKHARQRIIAAVGGAVFGAVAGSLWGLIWFFVTHWILGPKNVTLDRCVLLCAGVWMVVGTLVGSSPREPEGAARNGVGRLTRCYRCKEILDPRIHPTCWACGWMKCPACGACGCGYYS
jgi:hypothetical protein